MKTAQAYVRVSLFQSDDMSDQDLLERPTYILRNTVTELEGTESADRTIRNNKHRRPHDRNRKREIMT